MGLAQINHEFPSPAGRFLLLTTKVINLTLLSKDYPIFFLDAANLEINQVNPLPFFHRTYVTYRFPTPSGENALFARAKKTGRSNPLPIKYYLAYFFPFLI
jgi:hypothetical protein